MADIINGAEKIEKYWFKKTAPIYICIFFLIILLLLLAIPGFNDHKKCIIIVLILFFSTFIVWIISYKKLPKAQKNHIGILIALKTNDKTVHDKINWELIERFESYLMDSNANFQILRLKKHIIDNFNFNDNKKMVRLLKKTSSRLCIYGRCDFGNYEDNDEVYSIEPNYALLYQHISEYTQKLFENELKKLLCGRMLIPKKSEIKKFDNNSKMLEVSCKYLFAITAFLSRDIGLSKSLFEEIESEIEDLENSSYINTINNRVKIYLGNIYSIMARVEYNIYRDNKLRKHLDNMRKYSELMNSKTPNTYVYLMNMCIYYFLDKRQIDKSRKFINTCICMYGNDRNAVWIYNDAFLDIYEGKLKSGFDKYLKAFKKEITSEEINEMEEVILCVINDEPDKYQLYFSLGLINHYYKKEYKMALKYFGLFLNHPNNSYKEIKMIVYNIVSQITKNKLVEDYSYLEEENIEKVEYK